MAFAVEHVSLGLHFGRAVRGNTHSVRYAKSHTGVLVILQHNIALRSFNRDGIINESSGLIGDKTDLAKIRGDSFARFAHPFGFGINPAILGSLSAVGDLFAAVGVFAPEIMHRAVGTFHMAMPPEHTAMMYVIVRFAG